MFDTSHATNWQILSSLGCDMVQGGSTPPPTLHPSTPAPPPQKTPPRESTRVSNRLQRRLLLPTWSEKLCEMLLSAAQAAPALKMSHARVLVRFPAIPVTPLHSQPPTPFPSSLTLPVSLIGYALSDGDVLDILMKMEQGDADLMQLLWSGKQWGNSQQQDAQQQQEVQQLMHAPHYLDLSSVKQLLHDNLSRGDVCAGTRLAAAAAAAAATAAAAVSDDIMFVDTIISPPLSHSSSPLVHLLLLPQLFPLHPAASGPASLQSTTSSQCPPHAAAAIHLPIPALNSPASSSASAFAP